MSLLPAIDARIQNINTVDFGAVVGDAQKIVVFWDAHGWEAADGVLCRLLPAVSDRDHIVSCHDMSDNRYVATDRSYNGRMFWRGPEHKDVSARYNIGWVNTQEPQFIPLMDFLWRNNCSLRSADEDLALWRKEHADRQAEIEDAIGREVFSAGCHWGYFSLNDAEKALIFPTPGCTEGSGDGELKGSAPSPVVTRATFQKSRDVIKHYIRRRKSGG